MFDLTGFLEGMTELYDKVSLLPHVFSKTQGTDTTLTVKRTKSRGVTLDSAETLTGGEYLYTGDELEITCTKSDGDSLVVTVNGTAQTLNESDKCTYDVAYGDGDIAVVSNVPDYTITYYDGETELTELTPTGYDFGVGCTLPDYDKDNYTFDGWHDNAELTGDAVTAVGTTSADNLTFYAKTTIYKYDYTLTGGANGTVAVTVDAAPVSAGEDVFDYGDEASISITPNAGYTVGTCTMGGVAVELSESGGVWTGNSTITGDLALEVAIITYDLAIEGEANATYAVTVGGQPVVEGSDVFNHGDTAAISITPSTGYVPGTCTMGGADISLSETEGVWSGNSTVTGDVALAVALETFDYTLTGGTNGTVSVTVDETPVSAGTDVITYGDSAVISIDPNDGYGLTTCTMNGEAITFTESEGVYSATVSVTGDLVLTIAILTYDLTLTGDDHGTVSVTVDAAPVAEGSDVFEYGDTASLSIEPDTGYEIAACTMGGVNIELSENAGVYTATPTVSGDIVITLAILTYDLAITGEANATIITTVSEVPIAEGSDVFNYGDELEISITPNTGYSAGTCTMGAGAINLALNAGVYTATITVTGDIALEVAINTYDLTLTNGEHATIVTTVDEEAVAAGTDVLTHGDELEISITPDSGYEMDTCTMGGETLNLAENGGVYTATVTVTGVVVLAVKSST